MMSWTEQCSHSYLDLREFELYLVPVDGLDGEVGGVGDQVVIRPRHAVHQDVETRRHLGAHHHAEYGGLMFDVCK